jgi:hypothetical protein
MPASAPARCTRQFGRQSLVNLRGEKALNMACSQLVERHLSDFRDQVMLDDAAIRLLGSEIARISKGV